MPNENIGGISVSISVGLQDLEAQLQQAQQMADAAGKAMAAAFNSSTGSLIELGNAASDASGKVGSLSTNLSTAANGFTNAGIVMSALSVGIVGLGVEALTTAGKFEQWDVSFTRLLGSASAAKDMLSQLVDFAISTPFEIKDLVPNAQKLMAMGFAAQEVIPMLRTLGDAVSGLGKGADSLNSLTLAFGEMEGKGVIQLRQLNMLAIQGIPAIELLAEAYGKSTLQITDMISHKLIPASEGIPILLAGINAKFGGMMDAQSQTLLGMWSNLQDATTKTFNAIGGTMLPLFKNLEQGAFSALSVVQKLAELFGELPAPVQEAAIAIAAIVAAIGPLLLGLGAVSFALKSLVELPAAIAALGTALGLVNSAMASAGVTAAVATPEVTALAIAEASTGTAASISAIQLGLFGEAIATETVYTSTAITQLGLFSEELGAITLGAGEATFGFAALDTAVSGAVLAFGALVGYKVGQWAYENVPGVKSLGDAITETVLKTPFLGAAIDSLINKLVGVDTATKSASENTFLLSQKLGELGIVIPRGTMSMEEWGAALAKAATAHQGLAKAVVEGAAGLLKLQETFAALQENVDKAKAVLAAAAQGMKDGTVTAGEYAVAANNLEQAVKKLASAQGEHSTATRHSADEAKNWNDVISASLGLAKGNKEVVTDLSAAFKFLGDQIAAADELWKHYIVDADQAMGIMEKGAGTVGGFTVSMENGVEMIKGSAEALQTTSGKILDFTTVEGQATSATDGLTSSLGSQSSSFDHLGVTAEAASKKTRAALTGMEDGFAATTGKVDALSVGVAFLAMQLSGLTAFAGSGDARLNGVQYSAADSLYAAQRAAGDPLAQPTNFTVATGGPLKGKQFESVDALNQALADLAKNAGAAASSTSNLASAVQNGASLTTQYVDGVGNVYDSYQKMIDAINANPDLGGLTSTITTGTTALQNLSNAVGQSGSGTTGAVTGLTSNVTDLAGAAISTAQAVSLAAATMQVATTDLNNSSAAGSGQVRGPDGKMYSTAQDLYNAIQANPNLLPHTGEGPTSSLQFGTGDTGNSGGQFTFNGQSVTEAMYNALMQGMKGGSTAMSADILPAMQNNGTPSGFTGTSGTVYKNDGSMQPITVNMSYPQFNNQQQADQTMKQIVTLLRTVAGQKL